METTFAEAPPCTIVYLDADDYLCAVPQSLSEDETELDLRTCPLDYLEIHFTEGFCWQLAIQLHEVTGLPLFDVDRSHVVVGDSTDGLFLDIKGWSTTADLESEWGMGDGGRFTIAEITVAKARTWGNAYEGPSVSDAAVRVVAERLIAVFC